MLLISKADSALARDRCDVNFRDRGELVYQAGSHSSRFFSTSC